MNPFLGNQKQASGKRIQPALALVESLRVPRSSYGEPMQTQARGHNSHSDCEGERRVRIAMPALRHDRDGKGERRKSTIGDVGTAGA